uniref:Peptidase C1A papain C-terminal domain-containing protein n=1 Tax=Timema genevievae TaxID=629358 RepID=A0A7R9JXC9_TIMGE|nr:unnamed protein product [Timema genevievae]
MVQLMNVIVLYVCWNFHVNQKTTEVLGQIQFLADQVSGAIGKRHVFHHNMDFINRHNELHDRNERPFRVTRNKFAHMSVSEMCSRYTGLIVDEETDPIDDEDMSILGSSETGTSSSSGTTDTSVGGTSDTAVSVECLEAQWLKVKNRSVGLSEQYLIDCSDQKCSGGTFKNVFEFIKQNWTVSRKAPEIEEIERSVILTFQDTGSCHEISRKIATLKSYRRIPAKNEAAMMKAIADHGPIVCGVCASSQGFMLYHSGIFSSRQDAFLVPSYLQLETGCFTCPQVYSAQDRMFYLSPGIFSSTQDAFLVPSYLQLETGCFPCPQVSSAQDRMFYLSPGIFSLRRDVFLVPSYLQLETGCFPCSQVYSCSRQDVFLVPRYIQLKVGCFPCSQVYSAQGRMFSLSPGIFSLRHDGENCTTLNHAISLWGYVNDNNRSYFILKNSWGPAWGEKGYMRLQMGENNCGVGDLCYYITVE